MNDSNDFDDIDRALFTLPLEAPPADLRSRILASTIHAPLAVRAPIFGRLETLGIIAACALIAVLAMLTLVTPGLANASETALSRSWASLSSPGVWLWIAIGGAAAAGGWLFDIELLPARRRQAG